MTYSPYRFLAIAGTLHAAAIALATPALSQTNLLSSGDGHTNFIDGQVFVSAPHFIDFNLLAINPQDDKLTLQPVPMDTPAGIISAGDLDTPSKPDTSNIPDTPVSPDPPESLDTPSKPDTSNIPDTPVSPSPSDDLETPDSPDSSDKPDPPTMSDTATMSDIPNIPDTPNMPDKPEAPEDEADLGQNNPVDSMPDKGLAAQ